MKAAKQLSEIVWDDRHVSFAKLLDNDGSYEVYPIPDPRETIAALQYTGGTTGLPKGAMLTHANLTSACQQAWETTNGTPTVLVEGQECLLAMLPPFHIYALTVNVLFAVFGGSVISLHQRFEVEAVIDDISKKNVSIF